MVQEKYDKAWGVRNGDRLSGAVVLALGLYVSYEALKLKFGSVTQPGPGFYPTVLALLLVVVSAALIFHSSRPREKTLQVDFGARTSHVAITSVAIIIYAAVLEGVGFLLCTFVLVLTMLVGIGKVTWLRSLVVALAGTVAVYAIFTKLGIPLPKGVLPF
jgi:putative tricarboxylic transport membrane protein